MKRDLTEFDKLELWLRLHANDYNLQYTRYDNEDAYAGCEEVEKVFNYEPIDKHILHVYRQGSEAYFTAICEEGSMGSTEGLIEIHGDLVDPDRIHEGWLRADEIIRRIENEYAQTSPAM